ncbi:WXG100 family type VII secretion target [Streptomyces sviceus]|uniref:WXG100 family type VII secretion target n=1 Tax=Streptomyces sviceus TaxID=285530 RepID=UPI00368135CC
MAGNDKYIDYDYVEMNMCFNEKHTTPFSGAKNMDEMKAMVRHARPDLVEDVVTGWKGVQAQLVTIQRDFEKEVARIQEHWKGAAADGFAQKAKQVSKSIGDTSKYAGHTALAMANAAYTLGKVKDDVLAMEKPSTLSSWANAAGDGFTRSGEGTDKDIAAGKGAQEVLDRNHDDLSAGREAQLKMAAKMETLGASYNSQAKAMGSWNKRPVQDGGHDIPGDPGGITPTPVATASTTSPRSPQKASVGTTRHAQTGTISQSKSVTPPSVITGEAHQSTAPVGNVGTAIDGISGGHTGTPTVSGGGFVGGGSAGGAVGGGAGVAGGGAGVVGGVTGAARGAMVGRPGVGGTAGRAGAGAAAGAAGSARSGGSARQAGGISGGTPRAGAGVGAGAGRGTAGGSGLHNSRGAASRGASAVRKGGIAGTPNGRNGRSKDEEQRERERPDYLVEDEETWTPQRNVAPRVIEE